jgi:hypothetical protein
VVPEEHQPSHLDDRLDSDVPCEPEVPRQAMSFGDCWHRLMEEFLHALNLYGLLGAETCV